MKNKQLTAKKYGFTIIELSIVLIIISLISGGIFLGSNLVSQAKLTAARQMTSKSPVLDIDGLVFWFETTILKNANQHKISSWNNLADFKEPAEQALADNQPTYIEDVINDLPVLRFDDTADFLTFDGSSLINNNYTIFIVAARNSNKVDNMILGGTATTANNNLQIGYATNTSFIVKHYAEVSNINYVVPAYTTPKFAIHSIEFNTNDGKTYYENGDLKAEAIDLANKTSLAGWNGAAIGRFDTKYFQGDIAEIIMFNRALSDDERQDVEQYLSKKWKIV